MQSLSADTGWSYVDAGFLLTQRRSEDSVHRNWMP